MMDESCLPYNGQKTETQAINAHRLFSFPHPRFEVISSIKYFLPGLSVMWYGVFTILEYK